MVIIDFLVAMKQICTENSRMERNWNWATFTTDVRFPNIWAVVYTYMYVILKEELAILSIQLTDNDNLLVSYILSNNIQI